MPRSYKAARLLTAKAPDPAVHGDYELLEPEHPNRRETMDPKLKDVFASVIAAVGAVILYMGWSDATTWAQVSGGLMTLIAVVLPYVWKKPEA